VTEPNERRSGPRHQAYLSAEVVVNEDIARSAVTKDVSKIGLLLLTRAKLTEGQVVKLKIHRPGEEDRPLELSGTVVRRQPLGPDEIGTWREKVAFVFHEEQPDLAKEFAALAEKQARLAGGSTPPAPPEAG
jgi:hypothetical protein